MRASPGPDTLGASPAALDTSRRIDWIDLLRFAAAASVVAYHWLYSGVAHERVVSIGSSPPSAGARFGSIGVAVFFVISGFVITRSAAGRTAREFAWARFARLYPAFWAALALTSIATLVDRPPWSTLSPSQLLANITMVPALFGHEPLDGVYWTLLYELAFYAVVFVMLLARRFHWHRWVFSSWSFALAAISLVAPVALHGPLRGGWTAFFLAGALVADLKQRPRSGLAWLGLAACVVTAERFALVVGMGYDPRQTTAADLRVWALLVVLAIASVAIVLLPAPARAHVRGARTLGALTYPMYLLHSGLGYMALNRWATSSTRWTVLAVLVVALLLCAFALHHLIEVRLVGTVRTWAACARTTRTPAAQERLGTP